MSSNFFLIPTQKQNIRKFLIFQTLDKKVKSNAKSIIHIALVPVFLLCLLYECWATDLEVFLHRGAAGQPEPVVSASYWPLTAAASSSP